MRHDRSNLNDRGKPASLPSRQTGPQGRWVSIDPGLMAAEEKMEVPVFLENISQTSIWTDLPRGLCFEGISFSAEELKEIKKNNDTKAFAELVRQKLQAADKNDLAEKIDAELVNRLAHAYVQDALSWFTRLIGQISTSASGYKLMVAPDENYKQKFNIKIENEKIYIDVSFRYEIADMATHKKYALKSGASVNIRFEVTEKEGRPGLGLCSIKSDSPFLQALCLSEEARSQSISEMVGWLKIYDAVMLITAKMQEPGLGHKSTIFGLLRDALEKNPFASKNDWITSWLEKCREAGFADPVAELAIHRSIIRRALYSAKETGSIQLLRKILGADGFEEAKSLSAVQGAGKNLRGR